MPADITFVISGNQLNAKQFQIETDLDCADLRLFVGTKDDIFLHTNSMVYFNDRLQIVNGKKIYTFPFKNWKIKSTEELIIEVITEGKCKCTLI